MSKDQNNQQKLTSVVMDGTFAPKRAFKAQAKAQAKTPPSSNTNNTNNEKKSQS